MSLFSVNVESLALRDARLSVDLGNSGKLRFVVDYQGDRFTRVEGVWLPTARADRVPLVCGYLDAVELDLVPAEVVAERSPRRMHAHTIHGRDYRRLLDEGVIR
jgi:hypothetical protein